MRVREVLSAVRTALQIHRTAVGADRPEPGLREQVYSAPAGVVVAVKDNLVLQVDTTDLPAELSPIGQPRLQFAVEVTVAVFACWTGSD